jgi:hypothetical protein
MQKIGTKQIMDCYDGKKHECTLTDYLIRLTGNTYKHRGMIYDDGFKWDDDDKAWYKNCDTEEEINKIYKKFRALNITVAIKPIFRITD